MWHNTVQPTRLLSADETVRHHLAARLTPFALAYPFSYLCIVLLFLYPLTRALTQPGLALAQSVLALPSPLPIPSAPASALALILAISPPKPLPLFLTLSLVSPLIPRWTSTLALFFATLYSSPSGHQAWTPSRAPTLPPSLTFLSISPQKNEIRFVGDSHNRNTCSIRAQVRFLILLILALTPPLLKPLPLSLALIPSLILLLAHTLTSALNPLP